MGVHTTLKEAICKNILNIKDVQNLTGLGKDTAKELLERIRKLNLDFYKRHATLFSVTQIRAIDYLKFSYGENFAEILIKTSLD